MKKILLNMDITSMVIMSVCFGFILWISYFVFHDNQIHIYAENSLIENIQACLLAVASIIYLAAAALEKRSDKLILMFCFLLCLGFLLRELDVERFDIPYALIFIGSGTGRNVILTAAFVVMLICALLKLTHYKMAAVEFVKSRPGWLLIVGGVFLLIGQFFEKSNAISRHHVFLEEINELFGYFLILSSAISANSFMNRITINSSGRDKACN